MIFSSFRFLIFFPIVLLLYLACRRLRYRQVILLLASYLFYLSWDARFLSLICLSTLVDYMVGLRLPKASTLLRRRLWLGLSLSVNLGILGFFKYAGFFIESFLDLLEWCGLEPDTTTLWIILPVGISFYTLQGMSYCLDVYRNRVEPCGNLLEYAVFSAFFPKLIAGPIVRAEKMLPQIRTNREMRWVDLHEGINRFLIGFSKKVLIADHIAYFSNHVFNDPASYDALTLWAASVGFAVQVYCDYSGYADMAVGSARILGFRLPESFCRPLLALNVREFWRRWNITVYTFMRDYLYLPLGGASVGAGRFAFNILLTTTLVGFWHGAGWRFLVWGLYNGVLLLVHRSALPLMERWGAMAGFFRSLPGKVLRLALTQVTFFIGLALFCSPHVRESLSAAWRMITFDPGGKGDMDWWIAIFYGFILACCLCQERGLFRKIAGASPLPLKWAAYITLLLVIVLLGVQETKPFFYFQF